MNLTRREEIDIDVDMNVRICERVIDGQNRVWDVYYIVWEIVIILGQSQMSTSCLFLDLCLSGILSPPD